MITIQYNGFVSWQSWDFIKKNTMFMGFVFVYNHIKNPINKSKKHQSDLLGAVFLNFPQFFSEFSFFNQGNLPNHSPMAPWPSCTPPVGSCHPRSCPRSRPGSSSPHAPRRRGRAGSGRPGRPVCSCWPWSLGIPSIIHPGGWIDMNGILMDMNGWGYI